MARFTALSSFTPRLLLVAASTLALSAAAAASDGPIAPLQIAPRSQPAGSAQPADTIVKRLPADANALTFRGEMTSRRFAVVLGRSEASRIGTFQLALRNTVSSLPEQSAVTVAINGRTLATLPANAADKQALLAVTIPSGLLVPGANTVQVTTSLTHRVDCSVPATYELWATLDPGLTGFLVPRSAAESITSLGDLAAAPLDQGGTMRIHLRLPENPDEAAATDAARAVQMLVRRAKLSRPVVEIGTGAGTGSGFDLVVAGHEPVGFNAPGKIDGIGLMQDAGGRVTVVVDPGADDDSRPTPTKRLADSTEATRDGFRKSFAQFGKATEVFTGRRYEQSLAVTLPADFISTNDRARLLLDGSHAATLMPGDGLSLRVNGTLVSYLPLAAGKAERFDHRELELPLRFFHPGYNEVTIEGMLSAEADAQCKTATMPREARLTIAETSVLEFPGFAHLTTLPQIPVAMAANGDLPVYLPDLDPVALGTGLTVLANMVADGSTAAAMAPRVRIGAPDETAPGLVVASAAQLPVTLTEALRSVTRPASPTTADPAAKAQAADGSQPSVAPDATPSRLSALAETMVFALQNRGFFFGRDRDDGLELTKDDLVVAAVTPGGKPARSAFDVMPRFTQDATHWTVVTAADPATLAGDVQKLAASGRWGELRGEVSRFDPTDGSLEVRQPGSVTYVLTRQIAPADVRPILGGMMSDNILMSLGVLFVVMGALGLSTHAVVRRMGVK